MVLGKSEIDDVNEKLQMNIPDTKEYDTFSGYVLDQIGRIPEEKEEFNLGNYIITVQEMDGTRINKYVVKMNDNLTQETDMSS
jgi:CBS domain containing-hemolysin-like protein